MDKAQVAASDILDAFGGMILVLDNQGRILDVNRRTCQILERSREALLGQSWFDDYVVPEHREKAIEIFREMMEGGRGPEFHYENPIFAAHGIRRTISWCHSTLFDPKGQPRGSVSCGQDVTERANREAELKGREAQWRAILDATVDGIITINARGDILNFNSSASRIFGYSSEEILGRNIAELMPEPDSSNHSNYIQNYLESGHPKIIGIGREVYGRKKSGELFPLYLAVGEVSLPGERLFTGIVRDLTTFNQMQDELVRSENLAALGEMAATVAHEIKNPLAGISGAIQVLQDTLDARDPRRSVMDEILGQVQRLDNTVRQLLVLSKPWTPDPQVCELRSLLRKISRIFTEVVRAGRVRFVERGLEELEANVDPTLLEKVVINLIQNSIEAMPDGGLISIGLDQDGDSAVISIADDGPGIPAKIGARAFDPFVTSKMDGTGLGLPICRKIMQAHKGSIEVLETSDLGTVVEVRFKRDLLNDPE